jgi:phage terminase large subunit-like protein
MALSDKKIELLWSEFRDSVRNSTPVDKNETPEQKRKRMTKLEANVEEWFKYYFPKYAFSEPAPFHKKATQRVINNPEWYEVRSWSRELAKSTRTMFEVLFLGLTGKKRYVLMISNNETNATNLLEPYRIQLDSNQRIINDYGIQETLGRWSSGEFVTRNGVAFKAIGAGQSPRGTRNEEVRPDVLLFDDLDTDEDCRNLEMITKRWRWIEDAAIGTRSISKGTLIIFCGNIIAKDCCVVRAQQYADWVDIINIRDKNGNSTWPSKNSQEQIDRVLAQKSYLSTQKEYFNNPIQEGTVFKAMNWKTFGPLSQYKFLVCYIDLSYKSSAKNDYKAATLVGKWKEEYHVLKAFLKQGTTSELAAGLVDINAFVNGKCPIYWYAEENFLQDIILKEVQESLSSLKSSIVISPDKRAKADKFTRIEAALEPINTKGKLYLNESERDNPSMKTLEEQFMAFGPKSKAHDDGPDSVEGAKFIVDSKYFSEVPIVIGRRQTNQKRY